MDIHKVIGKVPFKLDSKDNQLSGYEPYNAVDVISTTIHLLENVNVTVRR